MSESLREISAKLEATLFELDRLRRFRASIMADCKVNLDRIHAYPTVFDEWIESHEEPEEMSDEQLDAAVHLLQCLAHSTGERAACARAIKSLLIEVGRLQEWKERLEDRASDW